MEHCPILRHLYSKSSWMRRVIPLRLLALPAELKTTLLIELGGRIKKYLNERMPCAQTRLFVAASQRLFHLFTCVHLFPCYWEEGWASTGCVLSESVSVWTQRDHHYPHYYPTTSTTSITSSNSTTSTTSTNSTNSTNGLSAHTEGPPHVNSSCKAD